MEVARQKVGKHMTVLLTTHKNCPEDGLQADHSRCGRAGAAGGGNFLRADAAAGGLCLRLEAVAEAKARIVFLTTCSRVEVRFIMSFKMSSMYIDTILRQSR